MHTLCQAWYGRSVGALSILKLCVLSVCLVVCHIQTVYTSLMIVQDMVFLSGHCPGATESQGICQVGLYSTTLQLEIDHMMVFAHRWLPATWESLNDALPKCRG